MNNYTIVFVLDIILGSIAIVLMILTILRIRLTRKLDKLVREDTRCEGCFYKREMLKVLRDLNNPRLVVDQSPPIIENASQWEQIGQSVMEFIIDNRLQPHVEKPLCADRYCELKDSPALIVWSGNSAEQIGMKVKDLMKNLTVETKQED